MEGSPQLQEPQAPISQPPPIKPSRVWWWVGGIAILLLLAGGILAWSTGFLLPLSLPAEVVSEQESGLSTVCCSTLPSQEYKVDDEHVYALHSWKQSNNPDYEKRMREKLSEITGTSYVHDEILAILEGLDPRSLRTEGRYIVDAKSVYGIPLDISGDISNGRAEYVGIRDGVAVLGSTNSDNRWYHFDPVDSYKGWVIRDLITGEVSHTDPDPSKFIFDKPDPVSFTEVGEGFYKDKDYVYRVTPQTHLLHVVDGINSLSFEDIGKGKPYLAYNLEGQDYYLPTLYLKDKSNIYVELGVDNLKIVSNADPLTFEIVAEQENYDAQDKNHKYLRGEIVE